MNEVKIGVEDRLVLETKKFKWKVNNLNELHLKPERQKWLILEMINW